MTKNKSLLELPLKSPSEPYSTLHEYIQGEGGEFALNAFAEDEELILIECAINYMSMEPNSPIYVHSIFTKVNLPLRPLPPSSRNWRKSDGKLEVVFSSGLEPKQGSFYSKLAGLPYGAKARLIIYFICNEVYRTKSCEIDLTKSLSKFMKCIGSKVTGGDTGTIKYFKDQLRRIARMRVEAIFHDSNHAEISELGLHGTQLWQFADYNRRENPWPQHLLVNQQFVDSVLKHGLPLDRNAVMLLKNNAFAMDWYCFLKQRGNGLKEPYMLMWKVLERQLSADYKRLADFRKSSVKALKLVGTVFPEAKLIADEKGITLLPYDPEPAYIKNRKRVEKLDISEQLSDDFLRRLRSSSE
ncbi:hypothetical protein GCM10011332_31250 [Terasakiella brassicae]|uniref:Replication protein n=1 Tax=Terasakiella brassicae TaxID=1634917 RepID=A0A917C6V5_9PROT|nr:replication protein RepA [Terasakiella brassicae]GGF74951.1 hypothetical protein GCM10011332_31250 [Terasakiella brassicae]